MFNYIYENDYGATCFDKYFEHLKNHESSMPLCMRDFFLDPARYELNGSKTLHDSRLLDFRVFKQYDAIAQVVLTSVHVSLYTQWEQGICRLEYDGVTSIAANLTPDRWLERPVDLLTHELSIYDGGQFRHFFLFDRGVAIDIKFTGFNINEDTI